MPNGFVILLYLFVLINFLLFLKSLDFILLFNLLSFFNNLFTINSSINNYKNKLNRGIPKYNKNPIGLKYKLLDKSYNASLDIDNMIANNTAKDNKSRIRTNKEKIKIPTINIINNSNENINIIDNTEDENNSNDYENKASTIEKTSKKKISAKNAGNNFKGNKDKFIKKSIKKLNHVRLLKHNSNFQNNQEDIKVTYYLNEIDQKKTIDPDNFKNHKNVNNTEILEHSDNKKKHFIAKNENKNRSINNRTELLGKEKKSSMRKKKLIIHSSIMKHNSGLAAIENALRTEPNKSINANNKNKKTNKYNINEKSDKKQFYSKKISTANTNNLNPKNKNRKNNYSKNLNKTANNFTYNSINNSSNKNPFNTNNHNNILELINTSSSNYNNTVSSNNNANKKINNRKSSQVIQGNNKKPCVTIKNTVINLNIDTGIILSSIDKKRKAKKINSKRGTNNSISQINNNNQIYNLDSKYNKYLANDEIDHLNRSTNENYPLKTKSINLNENYNLISLNEDIANNNIEIINKNSNFQKIYVYGDKSSYKKNLKTNNIKETKNDNNKQNTNNMNSNDKKHGKYKSMKLDDYYSMKGKKKESKDMFINNNNEL